MNWYEAVLQYVTDNDYTYLNKHDFLIQILYKNCYWLIASCL